jgi:hypothetical protein
LEFCSRSSPSPRTAPTRTPSSTGPKAKKIREYTSEVAVTLLHTLGADPAKMEAPIQKLEASRAKYAADAEKIQTDAKAKDDESDVEQVRALRFDIGEGLLELGLVLCSLCIAGTVMGIWGFLL